MAVAVVQERHWREAIYRGSIEQPVSEGGSAGEAKSSRGFRDGARTVGE